MADHANVQRIRQTYSALATGDVTAVLQNLAPHGVLHLKGSGPLSGDHTGHAAVTAALAGIIDLTAGSLSVEVSGVFADDRHGVVVLRERASRPDGATLDVEEVHVLALDGEGLITDIWDLPDDPEAHDRFFDGL
jgi:ketosteroid isomerase-like protein